MDEEEELRWCEELGDDVRKAACRMIYNSLQTGGRLRWGRAVAEAVPGAVAGTAQLKVQAVQEVASHKALAQISEKDVVKHMYVSPVAEAVLGGLDL